MLINKFKKSLINGFAITSLLIAFYIGQSNTKEIDLISHSKLFQEYQIDKICKEKGSIIAYRENELIGTISYGESQGYGGPLKVMILSDSFGKIIGLELIHDTETHAYIEKLKTKHYFDQYISKKVNDKFLLQDDITAVSGATISSNGIALASREASWKIASDRFSMDLPDVGIKWKFGLNEFFVLLIFILALIATQLKNKKLRYLSFLSSFILIGFLINASISLSHIARIILGFMPDIRQHLVWWILLIGNLLVITILGKNVYCNSICPFHAGQILLNKISGINFKIAPLLSKYLIQTPKFLLWLSLILILISKNPTLAAYEPFAMFFSLDGIGIQWYILPAALIGSLFISDFFCHYFCPVGASFRWLIDIRQNLIKHLKKQNG